MAVTIVASNTPTTDSRILQYLKIAVIKAKDLDIGIDLTALQRRGFPQDTKALLSLFCRFAVRAEAGLLAHQIEQRKKPEGGHPTEHKSIALQETALWLDKMLTRQMAKRLTPFQSAIGSIREKARIHCNRIDGIDDSGTPEANRIIAEASLEMMDSDHILGDLEDCSQGSDDHSTMQCFVLIFRSLRYAVREEGNRIRRLLGISSSETDNPKFIERGSMIINSMSKNDWEWGDSWYELVYKAVDEDMLKLAYNNQKTGSPGVPPAQCLCVLLLKEMLEIPSDKNLFIRLRSDREMRKAVRLDPNTDDCFDVRTLRNFKRRNEAAVKKIGFNPCVVQMNQLNCFLVKAAGVDCSRVRMDSTPMRVGADLSRMELAYRTNQNMIRKMRRLGVEIPLVWQQYHLKNDDASSHSYEERLQKALGLSQQLLNKAVTIEACRGTEELQHLHRLINDQMNMDENGNMVVIPGREVSPKSLQNPAAPEANYRSKGKGKNRKQWVGFALHFAEVYDSHKKLSLISFVDVQTNTYPDTKFGRNTVASFLHNKELSSLGIEKLVGDGAYHQPETIKKAAEGGIQYTTTKKPGKKREGTTTKIDKSDYNYRAGVEGVAAEFRRIRVDRLPERRLFHVRLRVIAKSVGYNLRQILNYGQRVAGQRAMA